MCRIPEPRSLLLVTLLATAACASVPKQTQSAKTAGLQASTTELRTRAVELGREMMREIEYAADSIANGTTDTAIVANTLYLKLSSVPGMTEAVLRDDPVIAMLDLYGFRAQLSDFFASPAGLRSLGKDVTVAQEAMTRFDARWEKVATDIGSHLTDAHREQLRAWARAHPIDRVPFTRTSLVAGMAYTLREESASIGASVGGMQESLDRLEFRISLVNEYGIKQGSWLAQLSALRVRGWPEVAEMREMMSKSQSLVSSSQSLVDGAPDLIERERAAMLTEVDRQRRATLADLAQERAIVLEAMSNERVQILAGVGEQRRLMMLDADSMRARLTGDSVRLVDHIMLRLAELGVLGLVATTLVVVLLRRRA